MLRFRSRLTVVVAASGALMLGLPGRAAAGLFDKLGSAAGDAAARATGRAVEREVDDATTTKREPSRPRGNEERSQSGQREKGNEGGGTAGAQAGGGVKDAKASAPQEDAAPEVYSNRYDFVTGDHVLLYDDFTESDVGEHPARWTFKGEGGGGVPIEVVQVGKQRFVKCVRDADQSGKSVAFLRYEIKEDMPRKFTIEFDADLAGPLSVVFSRPHYASSGRGQEIVLNEDSEGKARTYLGQVWMPHVTATLPPTKGIQHVAVAVADTQVKLYVGGQRVLVDPDGVSRPIKRIGMSFYPPAKGGDRQMFTNFRMAEGGKDAKTLLATGRIVTHGILFDTGMDVIRPESGPTLRSILALLQEEPSLRFRIEGHTDDQGGAATNASLSDRRAAAVKAWLTRQGVDAQRLEVKGFGSTKPLGSNDSPEGRANNRRVEFARL